MAAMAMERFSGKPRILFRTFREIWGENGKNRKETTINTMVEDGIFT
jgi:hypothetical protein